MEWDGRRHDRHGDERARSAVLEVTTAMLQDVGYQQLRAESVAARAGVPRSMLRRWWATRALLVAEALQHRSSPPEVLPCGDVRADVHAVVRRTAAYLADPVVADALCGLIADARGDRVAAERLAALLASRRAADAAVLLSAIARGDLQPDTDVPLLLDVVLGGLLMRRTLGAQPDDATVNALVELVLAGRATPRQVPDGDGWTGDQHVADGRGADGYGTDGYGTDGYGTDGRPTNGHGVDGHLFATPLPTGPGHQADQSDGV